MADEDRPEKRPLPECLKLYYILHPDTIALECDYQPPQQGSARHSTLKEIMDHNLIGPYQHRLDYGGLTLQPAGERRLAIMRREKLRALIVLATEERRIELSEKTEGGIIEKFVVGVIWRQVLAEIDRFRLGSLRHIEPPQLQGLVVDAPLAPMEAVVGPANNPKRAYGRDKENQAPSRGSKTKSKAKADGRQKRKTPIKQESLAKVDKSQRRSLRVKERSLVLENISPNRARV